MELERKRHERMENNSRRKLNQSELAKGENAVLGASRIGGGNKKEDRDKVNVSNRK